MTFDNSKTIISQRIKIFAVTLLILAYVFVTYVVEVIKFPLLGMNDTIWTIIVIGLYFVYALYPMVLNYQYVYFSDDGNSIIFKYFTSGIAGGRKNTIEISKESFAGYKIEKKYFGLAECVILYQQMREGVANYPPVYISNLTKKEKAKVLNSLYLHTPKYVKDVTPEHE